MSAFGENSATIPNWQSSNSPTSPPTTSRCWHASCTWTRCRTSRAPTRTAPASCADAGAPRASRVSDASAGRRRHVLIPQISGGARAEQRAKRAYVEARARAHLSPRPAHPPMPLPHRPTPRRCRATENAPARHPLRTSKRWSRSITASTTASTPAMSFCSCTNCSRVAAGLEKDGGSNRLARIRFGIAI